jgi:DNA-binding MarR family transcriptional regulator
MATPKTSSSEPPSAERRLPVLLRRAWFGLNQAFRRRIADAGLTPGQFTALRTLSERGDITQRELTAIMSSDANTIASLVTRMEKLGWVRRETHERDRRANQLHLTPAGKKKLVQIRPVAAELQERILGSLGKTGRAEFLRNLSLVADACQAQNEAGENE